MTDGGSKPGRLRPRFFVFLADRADAEEPTYPRAGDRLALSPEDSRHAGAVLRSRPGDVCEVVVIPAVGHGRLYSARFDRIGRESSVVLDEALSLAPPRVQVTLVQALTQPRLIDTVVEKGTETGVDRFMIVPAEGSPSVAAERLQAKVDRWRRIALEAAKQSKQIGVPEVTAVSMERAREVLTEGRVRCLAFDPAASRSLAQALPTLVAAGRVRAEEPVDLGLWIGPEGGWSESEVAWLRGVGQVVGMGRRVLRAETAGPIATALIRFSLRDF